jgi:FMN phosphatase YigB (HAD superfamily)
MHLKSPIHLVCLDVGGVLVRICSGWEEACRIANVELRPEVSDAAVLKQVVEVAHRLEHGQIDEETFDQEVGALVGLPPERIAAAAEAWLVEVYPGALELVDWLNGLPGIRAACLSNTTTRHWRMMTTPGQTYAGLERLPHQFLSFEIGHMKPSGEIFQHVEQVTGRRPNQILFFDDSKANVDGAKACGWHAELIDPKDDPPGQVRHALRRYGIGA